MNSKTTAELFAQLSASAVSSPSRDEVIEQLVADGGLVVKGLKIKSLNVTPFEDSSSIGVCLLTDGQVLGRCVDGQIGVTGAVMTTALALAGAAREDVTLSIFAQDVARGSDVLKVLLTGGAVDVLAQYVPAGEAYVNPFRADAEPSVYDHDVVIHHIIGLTPGPLAEKLMARKLAEF